MELGLVEVQQQNNKKKNIANIDEVEKSRDRVTILIEEKLQGMLAIVPECNIYRVPKLLFDMNHNAYVPQVISIGPLHHDQEVFKVTEELKLRLFNSYRCRVDMSIQGIVEKTRNWERRARLYYSETIDMNNDDFVKMMILDGCFIVEFMIVGYGEHFPKTKNMVNSSSYSAIYFALCRDLTKLENQLPFFVLEGLFDLVSPNSENILFEHVVHVFLNMHVLPSLHMQHPCNMSNKKPQHLVDFLSFYFVPLATQTLIDQINYLPPTTTELSEAGVILKKAEREEKRHIMDISFKYGILKIPPFEINDCLETYVRNLLAFEEFTKENSMKESEENDEKSYEDENKKYAIHYFEFLDELITTKKDVRLLVKEEIIINSIGGSEIEISEMFNNLCKNATKHGFNYFGNISKDLKKHCQTRQNRWMASLKHNYFNTSLTFISFLAATFLILLTLLQTISSFVSLSK